jgi:hypothetical protein
MSAIAAPASQSIARIFKLLGLLAPVELAASPIGDAAIRNFRVALHAN